VDKELVDNLIGLMAIAIILVAMVVSILYFLEKTPKKYHVCGSGWGAVCFTVNDKKDIIKKDNCVSDGVSQICGTYEINYY